MAIQYSDKNVIYTGEDVLKLDIKNGDSYDIVISKLISFINSSSPSQQAELIKYSGLEKNELISCQKQIINRNLLYSLTEEGGFLYSLVQFNNLLPLGYVIAFVEVSVYGSQFNNQYSLISKSNELLANIPITSDRIPLRIAISIGVNTPCGVLEFKNTIDIDRWELKKDKLVELYINNTNNIITFESSDDAINELIQQVNSLKSEINNLKRK